MINQKGKSENQNSLYISLRKSFCFHSGERSFNDVDKLTWSSVISKLALLLDTRWSNIANVFEVFVYLTYVLIFKMIRKFTQIFLYSEKGLSKLILYEYSKICDIGYRLGWYSAIRLTIPMPLLLPYDIYFIISNR